MTADGAVRFAGFKIGRDGGGEVNGEIAYISIDEHTLRELPAGSDPHRDAIAEDIANDVRAHQDRHTRVAKSDRRRQPHFAAFELRDKRGWLCSHLVVGCDVLLRGHR